MLPNLVIIGAMKCGTTSLHAYLDLHPQVCMSRIKEPEFFIDKHNWSKGIDWYQSLFTKQAKIVGESSTSYSKYPIFDGVPKRMHSIIPDANLIYVVRDPIQRIISQFVHRVAHYGEQRALEGILMDPENDYIYYSKYYMQLEQYLAYYPKTKILVIDFDELIGNTQQTMRRIFEYLEIDSNFVSDQYSVVFNQSSKKKRLRWLGSRLRHVRGFSKVYKMMPWIFENSIEKPTMSELLRRELIDLLKKDVNRLRSFSGCSFSKWCV